MPYIYISSYGENDKKGIYVANFEDNKLSLVQHYLTEDFPSYIIRKDNYLYASLKNASKNLNNGGIGIFEIKDHRVNLIDHYASKGRSYTHLCLSQDMKNLFVANYHVGTTAMYALDNPHVTSKVGVVYHEGKGPDPLGRQRTPHVHYVGLTPDNYVYSVDLGSDKVVLYKVDENGLTLVRKQDILPGSGPRHMVFSKDGRFAYLVNEIANTIMVFRYNSGILTMIQMISTLPRHYKGENSAAAIRLSKSGSHLFISNRGHDSIAMYSINQESGKLFLLYMVHTGKDPRDFNIYDDQWLVVGCQTSNWIEVLRLDLEKDIMERTGHVLDIPAPVCIEF